MYFKIGIQCDRCNTEANTKQTGGERTGRMQRNVSRETSTCVLKAGEKFARCNMSFDCSIKIHNIKGKELRNNLMSVGKYKQLVLLEHEVQSRVESYKA